MKRRRRMAKAYNCDTHGTHTKVMCPKCLDAGARKMAEVVLAMKDELLTEEDKEEEDGKLDDCSRLYW